MLGLLKKIFRCKYDDQRCSSIFGCKCGKGGATVVQSTPPPQITAQQSMEDYIKILPQLYETQFKYAPQEAQQQLELTQQYAGPLAEAYKQAQEQLYPGTVALQEQLATQAQAGMNEGLSAQEREQYGSDIKALLGENVSSPIGADYYGRGLMELDQQRKDYYRNLGLSMTNRQPLTQASTPITNTMASGFTPQDVMGFNTQNYGTYESASRPLGFYQNPTAAQNFGTYAAGAGSILSGIGSMIPGANCWVAAELFGGWFVPKTFYARVYINFVAPLWFKDFYLKYGERIAAWLKIHRWARMFIKPLFELFAIIGYKEIEKEICEVKYGIAI
jgi:uncharacterized protein YukE